MTEMKLIEIAILLSIDKDGKETVHQVIVPPENKKIIIELLKSKSGDIKLHQEEMQLTIGKDSNEKV